MRSSANDGILQKIYDQILAQIAEYAFEGNESVVKGLLRDNPEKRKLAAAIKGYAIGGHVSLVQDLLGEDPMEEELDHAIYGYALGGHEAKVNNLLRKHPDDSKINLAIRSFAIGGHESLVKKLLGDNPFKLDLEEAIEGYARGGHEALVTGLLGKNPGYWEFGRVIYAYYQGKHQVLINALILNTAHNLSTLEYREYFRELSISIPLLSEANEVLLTTLKEKLKMLNPANSDTTPLLAVSSSRAEEEAEKNALVKLSESDYKDLIKIISEQMVRDGDVLDQKKYLKSLQEFGNNHSREMIRLESIRNNEKTDDLAVSIQNNIHEYFLQAIDVFKLALAGKETEYERKTLQQVEKNGFLGNILAKRCDDNIKDGAQFMKK